MGIINKKILILGKIPPPIGGVTIHVQRLCEVLDNSNCSYKFMEISVKNLFLLPFLFKNFSVAHLHSSNPYVRIYFAIIGSLFKIKTILTIHGDLGRFNNSFKNKMDNKAIALVKKPIVLNKLSLEKALKYNIDTEIVSAFIAPVTTEVLPLNIIEAVNDLRSNYKEFYSTNAYNMTFDKNGNEIYGILELLKTFSENVNLNKVLIVSDPSGAYKNYIEDNNIKLNNNILIISVQHSYFEILKMVDASIRNTTTDGDPLSVKESLFLNKPVLATNVVDRPKDCNLYEVNCFLDYFSVYELSAEKFSNIEDGSTKLMTFYNCNAK